MQSYKTGQVGGRASQVGGIAWIVKGGRDMALEAEAQLYSDNISWK